MYQGVEGEIRDNIFIPHKDLQDTGLILKNTAFREIPVNNSKIDIFSLENYWDYEKFEDIKNQANEIVSQSQIPTDLKKYLIEIIQNIKYISANNDVDLNCIKKSYLQVKELLQINNYMKKHIDNVKINRIDSRTDILPIKLRQKEITHSISLKDSRNHSKSYTLYFNKNSELIGRKDNDTNNYIVYDVRKSKPGHSDGLIYYDNNGVAEEISFITPFGEVYNENGEDSNENNLTNIKNTNGSPEADINIKEDNTKTSYNKTTLCEKLNSNEATDYLK